MEKLSKEEILKQLKNEEEFTKWTVKIGRKAKKGRFERLLKEFSPEEKDTLVIETK